MKPPPSTFDLDRRTTFVVGAAKSGQSIARFLLEQGEQVLLSDQDPTRQLECRTQRIAETAPGLLRYRAGRHDPAFAAAADRLVLSPGVPMDAEIVGVARHHGVTVLGAVEFIASVLEPKLIVVTGTSGKTTLLDVVRRIVAGRAECDDVFLTDRAAGVSLAESLEASARRAVVAELSVKELDGTQRLDPELLVVTNLAKSNNHDEFGGFDAYFEAKLGWLRSIESPLRIVASDLDRQMIEAQLERGKQAGAAIEYETVSRDRGPTRALADRVRLILEACDIAAASSPQEIAAAIRKTLLARCETIGGFALPILNIGECKNPDALLWTASAVCTSPRVITTVPLDRPEDSSLAEQDVIDLNTHPIGFEAAIDRWAAQTSGAVRPTVVIDEATRRRFLAGLGAPISKS